MAMNDQEDERTLDAMLEAARRDPPKVPQALLRRIAADAERIGAERMAGARHADRRPAAAGPLARLVAALGGWQGLGGMAMAVAAGLWIGYAGIADPSTLSAGIIGSTAASGTVDLMPGADVFVFASGTGG